MNAQAAPSRYYLQEIKQREGIVLRLRDRIKHSIVWQCAFWHMRCPTFSRDHRAFAGQVRGEGIPQFGLLLWQEGKPMRVLTEQTFFNGDVDGIVNIAWSKDKQRLALLTWAGGGSLDARTFEIWYMNVPKKAIGYSGIKNVSRMKWENGRQVRYWKTARTMDIPHPAERISHVWAYP